jgi:hypothetical protein
VIRSPFCMTTTSADTGVVVVAATIDTIASGKR